VAKLLRIKRDHIRAAANVNSARKRGNVARFKAQYRNLVRKDALGHSTARLVKEYWYLVSMPSPYRRDRVKLAFQGKRRLYTLRYYMKSAEYYCHEFALKTGIPISVSKFRALKPIECRHVDPRRCMVCMCKYHVNARHVSEAISRHKR
jgi:hypothetical protein